MAAAEAMAASRANHKSSLIPTLASKASAGDAGEGAAATTTTSGAQQKAGKSRGLRRSLSLLALRCSARLAPLEQRQIGAAKPAEVIGGAQKQPTGRLSSLMRNRCEHALGRQRRNSMLCLVGSLSRLPVALSAVNADKKKTSSTTDLLGADKADNGAGYETPADGVTTIRQQQQQQQQQVSDQQEKQQQLALKITANRAAKPAKGANKSANVDESSPSVTAQVSCPGENQAIAIKMKLNKSSSAASSAPKLKTKTNLAKFNKQTTCKNQQSKSRNSPAKCPPTTTMTSTTKTSSMKSNKSQNKQHTTSNKSAFWQFR